MMGSSFFAATVVGALVGQNAAGLDGLTRQQNFVAQRASSANADLHKNGDGRG